MADEPITPPAPPEPPNYDAVIGELRAQNEDLRANIANLRESYAHLRGTFDVLSAHAPTGAPTPADVSDEDIAKAAEEMDGKKLAALFRQQAKAEADRAVQNLRTSVIDPITQKVDGYGTPTLAAHTRAIAAMSGDYKHYAKYKKEIDDIFNRLPQEQQVQPEAFASSYRYVIGMHLDDLVAEEVEQRLRQSLSDGGGGPTSLTGRAAGSSKVPTAADLFDRDTCIAVQEKGGEDAFARKFGYASWVDYIEQTGLAEGKKVA